MWTTRNFNCENSAQWKWWWKLYMMKMVAKTLHDENGGENFTWWKWWRKLYMMKMVAKTLHDENGGKNGRDDLIQHVDNTNHRKMQIHVYTLQENNDSWFLVVTDLPSFLVINSIISRVITGVRAAVMSPSITIMVIMTGSAMLSLSVIFSVVVIAVRIWIRFTFSFLWRAWLVCRF